jgi:hypothetical protein
MRKRVWTGTLAVALICAAPVLRADVWDLGTDSDNDAGTDNEIVHGLEQVHDLAAQGGGTVADEDWYVFRLPNASSFEIVLDGMTGDVSTGSINIPALDLIGSDTTTVVATGQPETGVGISRSLHVVSASNFLPGETSYFVRVSGASCGLNCTADDHYRIRAYNTTLAVPRFNNTSTQTTVLVLQNGSRFTASVYILGFDMNGATLGYLGFPLPPNGVSVYNTSSFFGGAAGGFLITNDGRYGQITGKAVALEPATGFTFDTPFVPRPH